MQDLTLVGVHDDGEHLVLTGPDGQRFRVPVDDSLRAAVRRDRARLGQLQNELAGRLRPRDIQARIRAGHTAQEVADEAGLPLEHVRRFEGPVLAEREFVARQARGVRVRRPGGGTQPTLGELVGERLARREVEDDTAVWDAFRREDGQWVVTLSFPAGGRDRRADWTFDPQLRHVVPLDDEARWLTEDEPAPGAVQTAGTQPGGRRLAPVPDPLRPGRGPARDVVYDVESDGAVRPAEPTDPAPSRGGDPARPAARQAEQPVPTRAAKGQPAQAASPSTVDLLDTLRERRGRRQRPLLDDEDPSGDHDPIEALLSRADELGEPPAAHPPRSRPELAADAEVLHLPDAEPLDARHPAAVSDPAAATGSVALVHDEPLPKAAGGSTERAGNRKSRRASVPSWDDIVFGSRRE
jgi:hypothetical protein